MFAFRDFNLLHRTFLKRFPLFIWLLFAVSSVSNFRPHTGGRRFSSVLLRGGRGAAGRCRCVWGALPMFRPHWVCPVQGCLCFPVYTAQAPGCSIWSGPCVECSSSFPVLHKSSDSVAPAFCAFPGLSGSGSQGLRRPLPSAAPASVSARACGVPGACVCSQELASSHDPPGSGPSRISGSLWIETGGLFAVWEEMPSLGLSLLLSPPPASYLPRV